MCANAQGLSRRARKHRHERFPACPGTAGVPPVLRARSGRDARGPRVQGREGAAESISREGILMASFAELRVKIHEEGNGEVPDMVPDLAIETRPEELRLLEALLFAASEPLDEKTLAKHLPAGGGPRAPPQPVQDQHA